MVYCLSSFYYIKTLSKQKLISTYVFTKTHCRYINYILVQIKERRWYQEIYNFLWNVFLQVITVSNSYRLWIRNIFSIQSFNSLFDILIINNTRFNDRLHDISQAIVSKDRKHWSLSIKWYNGATADFNFHSKFWMF